MINIKVHPTLKPSFWSFPFSLKRIKLIVLFPVGSDGFLFRCQHFNILHETHFNSLLVLVVTVFLCTSGRIRQFIYLTLFNCCLCFAAEQSDSDGCESGSGWNRERGHRDLRGGGQSAHRGASGQFRLLTRRCPSCFLSSTLSVLLVCSPASVSTPVRFT